MSDPSILVPLGASLGQLTQARVPLEEAAMAFNTRDEDGRQPIIVVPQRVSRLQNELLVIALGMLAAGYVAERVLALAWLWSLSLTLAIVLGLLAVSRAFFVQIPEGVNGLLARGGRYVGTIGPGYRFLLPYIVISHLVTRREIPYDVPVAEAPTADNVRASIDTLLTFSIVEPHKFVYNISADDFDRVLHASCQDALRSHLRQTIAANVADLRRADTHTIREAIEQDVTGYGVKLSMLVVTSAVPPQEFLRSQEARQFAVVQLAEQEEKQALALHVQADAAELTRHRIVAEAEVEALRLQRLEERLALYPAAARYDLRRARLEVARALAGNNRALLQVGKVDELSQALGVREVLADEDSDTNGSA
jgi:regulator of protease activity HflC (stomatin/prohibitin superfamily)